MEVIGLDLSLSATGIACADGATVFKPKSKGPERLGEIRKRIQQELYLHTEAPLVVVLEGYSYGSRNGGERLGELGGVIRLLLYSRDIPYVEVPPGTLKKYATGSGRADKEQVLTAAIKRGAEVDNNNAADSWWLRQMGLSHYQPSHPDVVPMPVANVTALDNLEWPEVSA